MSGLAGRLSRKLALSARELAVVFGKDGQRSCAHKIQVGNKLQTLKRLIQQVGIAGECYHRPCG